jgi:hypothetical protein
MRSLLFGALICVCTFSAARADITVFMDAWDTLPQAQITQGKADNCITNRTVFGPAQMAKGFRSTYSGAGSQGEDICWRRTSDPLFPNSGWTDWARCSSDGNCEIR